MGRIFSASWRFGASTYTIFIPLGIAASGQRYINITGNAIGPKSGQKDCRKF